MSIQNLFALMILLFVLHVLEQWFYDFEKSFTIVAKKLAPLQRRFGKNKGVFIVVMVVFFIWLTTTYFLLAGNSYPALLFWTILLLSEIHHVIGAIKARSYFPGSITGFLLFILGIVFVFKIL